MFDFGNANEAQKEAIKTTDGPVLIIAGPGTGKTFTIVKRAIYLIAEKGVLPEQIMMTTFTEKAAKELITRMTNEFAARNISVNIDEMYIGTFHSICMRLIKEYSEYSRLKKNSRVLDDFEQKYLIYQHLKDFNNSNIGAVIKNSKMIGDHRVTDELCKIFNTMREELIDAEKLCSNSDPLIHSTGELYSKYIQLLEDGNYLDFSSIQDEAVKILHNDSVLKEIREKIKYLIIDEYQDTNYIQEQIVLLIGGGTNNICVVGDDDQSIYRFRGATVRNILYFSNNFKDGSCKKIHLNINYRSNSDIVNFYNKWMHNIDIADADNNSSWGRYRYPKQIVAHTQESLKSPAVITVSGEGNNTSWYRNVLSFIRKLQSTGKITDLNQIAFLFRTVRDDRTVKLLRYLEDNGIKVYSPRSKMFFERDEIKTIIGCLLLMFPSFEKELRDIEQTYFESGYAGRNRYGKDKTREYYFATLSYVRKLQAAGKYNSLFAWIESKRNEFSKIDSLAEFKYTNLIYEMFGFEPFYNILNTDMDCDVGELRPSRNLALLTNYIKKFDEMYLHSIERYNKKIAARTHDLFYRYLAFLDQSGVFEYEDETEYAPSGYVSFLTIHQSKGLEFPVVIIGSLNVFPKDSKDSEIPRLITEITGRESFENSSYVDKLDFWRLYYTAFSRAQDLLVLTAMKTSGDPSTTFSQLYDNLKSYDDSSVDLNEFTFQSVKDVNIKQSYSFTSNISVYETCSLQYKFFKELGFNPLKVGPAVFGTLVHQTIEDIHKAALRKEEYLITDDNIEMWLNANYMSLELNDVASFGKDSLEEARKQVLEYAHSHQGDWKTIQEAEVDVSLLEDDYIIKGTVDLIKGEGDTVELVDFKSGTKPDLINDKELINRYHRQLQVYAHLVESRSNRKVSKLHLYYTKEKSDNALVSFTNDHSAVDTTIKEFDTVVRKIQAKKFDDKAESAKTCQSCDFKHYCKRDQ